MSLELTDEQSDFVDAVRDFCRARVRHARAARRADRRRQAPAQPGALQARWPSWAGSASRSPRSTAAPAAAWSTCACSSRRPPAGWPRSAASACRMIVGRRRRALRHRGAEAARSSAASWPATSRRSRCPSPTPARTSARCSAAPQRQNGGYVVNGQKTWISEAHLADHILLVCRTDRERRPSTRA